MKIQDGSGFGKLAKVDNDLRLWTQSVTMERVLAECIKGNAFIIPTPPYGDLALAAAPITAAMNAPVLWFKNNSTTDYLYINRICVSHCGGSTNHNRALRCHMFKETPTPSANHTTFTPGNLNFDSGRTFTDIEAYYWNGTGTGMTVASTGTYVSTINAQQGFTNFELSGGSIIVPSGTSISAMMIGFENTIAHMFISGYFRNKNDF